MAWVSDHVEVEVSQSDDDTVTFSIERVRENRPCFLSIGQLALFYRGQSLDPALDATVRAVAPRTLVRMTIEELAALIAADPDAGRPTEPLPSTPAKDQRSYDEAALLSTWGSPAVWTSFFATAEVARSQLDSLDFFNRCTFVQHCDLECLCVNPQLGAPTIPVVLYPWDDRVRSIDWAADAGLIRETARAEGPGMVTTDLDERDVITGRGAEKLSAALEYLTDKPVGAMVFCSMTCVPVVSGEDVDAVVRNYRDRFDVPVLDLTTTPQSMQGVFRELLVTRRLDAESQAPPPETSTINLVGYCQDPALEELRDLLNEIGARVNVAIFPALSPEIIDMLPKAGLNVVHPNVLWRGLYDQLQFDSRIDSISPPAPFGRAATARWIETIAAALDRDATKAIERALEHDRERWSRLRSQANHHRLGFVVRATDARFLSDPAQTWGIPLLGMCAEMGFHVEVLVHGPPSEVRKVRADLQEACPSKGRLHITGFEDKAQLVDLLSEPSLDAVYSEHFFDRRLSELGIAGFCGQHFERGFAGATRTIHRLLEVCSVPFFRRYGRILQRTSPLRGLPDSFGEEQPPLGKGRDDHTSERTQ